MFLLMLFMFFFFLGFVAMFMYLLRRLDNQTKTLADEHAQLRVLLRAMESRLDKLGQMERISSAYQSQLRDGEMAAAQKDTSDAAGRDPLLHLSFEKPRGIEGDVDPGLSLDLEPGGWDLSTDESRRDQA